MNRTTKKDQVVKAYLAGGTTTRRLAKESGYSCASVSRWAIAEKKEMNKRALLEKVQSLKGKKERPGNVKELRERLRMAELKICLLEAMIDVSDEQFGTDIRKKAGTRPS